MIGYIFLRGSFVDEGRDANCDIILLHVKYPNLQERNLGEKLGPFGVY